MAAAWGTAAAAPKWYYRDSQHTYQGPFLAAHMRSWFASGYFPAHTYAAQAPEVASEDADQRPAVASFRPIAAMWPRPDEQAFLVAPQRGGRAKRRFGDGGSIEFELSDDEELRHKKYAGPRPCVESPKPAVDRSCRVARVPRRPKRHTYAPPSAAAALIGPSLPSARPQQQPWLSRRVR